MTDSFRAPSWVLSVAEIRAPLELASLLAATPLRRRLPAGDGHSVLVIPGFMAPDASTAALRSVLTGLGYDAHGWDLGVNLGPRREVIGALESRVLALSAAAGAISLIGWSLGGIYARLLAREYPETVRTVITLASPFRMSPGDSTRATPLYEALERPGERWIWRRLRERPLAVQATSIFTKLDGVVDWRACLADASPIAESLEVRGASHIGLGQNPATAAIVADRLSQPPGEWAPYEVPRALRRVVIPHVRHDEGHRV